MNLFNLEAEQSVIAAVLDEPTLLNDLSELVTADDFGRQEYRDIFRSISELWVANTPVDAITVGEQLEKQGRSCTMSDVVDLQTSTHVTSNAGIYARMIRESARKRALLSTLELASRAVHDDRDSKSDDLIARAATMVGGLQCADGEGIRNTKQVISSLAKAWDRRMLMNGEIDGLPTGIKVLDQRFMGWKPGDLVTIAGRPSMGKSVLGMQIASHTSVVRGERSMVFSLEMTAEQLIQRTVANIGHIPLNTFRKDIASSFGHYSQQITTASHRIATADLLIDDTPGLHVNQICARARNAHRKSPLKLVVVDHIGLVRADGQSQERVIAQITAALKGLAKELGCPVVELSQLNRQCEQRPNKRPIMSDLRDSGSIEQDSDIVIFVYRDEYYNPDTMDKGLMEINTAKFREGEVGRDACAAILAEARVADLAYEWQPQEAPTPAPRRGID